MFRNLANYLLGTTTATTTTTSTATTAEEEDVDQQQLAADGVEEDVRLSANGFEDDWVLVDRDSEGNSDVESLESLDDDVDDIDDDETASDDDDGCVDLKKKSKKKKRDSLTRTSSSSSMPRAVMEESWFLTPPPCFTSAGPVHMETSPLENLLIEHPSMSVYNSQQVFIARRSTNLTQQQSPQPQQQQQQPEINAVAIIENASEIIVLENDEGVIEAAAIRVEAPRRNRVETLRQQERQSLKSKQAQKVQIQKACQSLKRGYLERNNKAREVNCRNQRLRRGERSQGATRSCANNNRKC